MSQYCTFGVSDLAFAIAVEDVQEVLRTQPETPVPLASPAVRGLLNLRGEIVTSIDMRTRLNLPPAETEPPINVIVRLGHERVSLAVDTIGDVIETEPNHWRPAPDTLLPPVRDVVSGVLALPDDLRLILDPQSTTVLNSSGPHSSSHDGGKP